MTALKEYDDIRPKMVAKERRAREDRTTQASPIFRKNRVCAVTDKRE